MKEEINGLCPLIGIETGAFPMAAVLEFMTRLWVETFLSSAGRASGGVLTAYRVETPNGKLTSAKRSFNPLIGVETDDCVVIGA